MDDIARIKEYIAEKHGMDVAVNGIRRLMSSARRLELFPNEGPGLEEMISVPTDYRYLYIKPNYLFYRIEGRYVKVVRVLNERQDFLRLLFGITTVPDDEE